MAHQDYSSSITSKINPAEAFDRIRHISDWWTAATEGKSQDVGDEFTVRFGETFVTFRVAESIPDKKAVWRVTDCNLHFVEDKKEWKDTRVVFEITSDGAVTTVTMTHAGLVPSFECYENCRTGWDFYIKQSLFQLLTEGQGLPDRRRRKASERSN